MIKQVRIKTLERHLIGIQPGEDFYVVQKVSDEISENLSRIGFPQKLQPGDCVLPRDLGPVSRFNIKGSYTKLKERPKETKYRLIYNTDWHGNYHFEDVPYKRYQRKRVEAPEVELIIREINGELYVTAPKLVFAEEQKEFNLHVINLFLECFGSCDILNSEMQAAFQEIPVNRVNWTILPQGECLWSNIPHEGFKTSRKGKARMQRHTFDTITRKRPDYMTIGNGGFQGYVVFHFESKGFFLLEHLIDGNATYVFDRNWEEFTKLSKKEIVSGGLQRARIIHSRSWEQELEELFNESSKQ